MSAPDLQPGDLAPRIEQAMRGDQFRFRRRLKKHGEDAGALAALAADIETSVTKRQRRAESLPRPEYDDQLPIAAARADILKAIDENQVVVLCGETGSGKTTQLPKLCLELGRGVAGWIGHTQPRRLAARSVAERIASELKGELGQTVGYKVRFSDRVGEDSLVKLMTDGILLAETQGDRFLEHYDTLIIDEAHERSLNIDFLLGYIKRILPRRPDLKVIITSATIDPERFSKHFDDAPVLNVSGRTYPVEVAYRPLVDLESDDERETSLRQGVADCVREAMRHGPGDILVFLPGERDIRDTQRFLEKTLSGGQVNILPLYGRLSQADQHKIFHGKGPRRIVLSTNVAETSVTVPGIVYVIDSGLARISRYSYRSKVQRLPIEPISRASADQRKGRCGRIAPGLCYRLYSEEDFESRPEFTDPEILRTNLAEVILQMEALRLGSVYEFPFIDTPDGRLINDGYKLLFELGAISSRGKRHQLTKLGQQMARLPIDPKLARMLIASDRERCLEQVLTLVSALSIQDPRERPHDHRQAADEAHGQWRDERSDFIALLNLWTHFGERGKALSQNQLRKWCRDNFLSWVRMREWRDTRRQLSEFARQLKLRGNDIEPVYEELHRALLTGLLGNIGLKDEKKEYQGPRNRRFHIFPGSGVRKRAQWVMAAEIFETSRVFAHTVAEIDPRWLENIAGHLLKKRQFEPHFHRKSGQVMAFEQATLYGLVVRARKRVNYSKIDPVESRHIFIRDALAGMELQSEAPFMRHNRQLLEDIALLEAKGRRRDLLLDEQPRIDFFEQRVPEGIASAAEFDQWRKRVERDDAYYLYLSPSDCLSEPELELAAVQFPDHLDFDGLQLPLSYHFQPGADNDGITLHIPSAALKQVDAARCSWLVPGWLEDKIAALIKGLPKSLRTQFVPVPDVAREAHRELMRQNPQVHDNPGTTLAQALADWLSRRAGAEVKAGDLNEAGIDNHLRLRYEVRNAQDQLIGQGRHLGQLQENLGEHAEDSYYAGDFHDLERDDITRWDFGHLPDEVEFEQNGVRLKGYPALVDMGDSVSIRLIDTRNERRQQHRQGLARLFQLQLRDQIKYLRRHIPDIDKLALWFAPVGSKEELVEDIIHAVTLRVFLDHRELPDNPMDFEAEVARGKGEMVEAAAGLSTQLVEILSRAHGIRQKIAGELPLNWIEAAEDIDDQLEWLIYPGFLSETPDEWLAEYPRYLGAIEFRLEKLDHAPDKDRLRRAEIAPLWDRFQHLWNELEEPQACEARWLIEELRVARHAQQLKTRIKTSPERVEKALDKLS
ncbi:MAG: ATP-dependent RNA helicase HrpA [Pseudomonadota bacterium]